MYEMTTQEKKDNVVYFTRNIELGKAKLEKLLDSVESERRSIKFYQEELDRLNKELLKEQVREEVMREMKQ